MHWFVVLIVILIVLGVGKFPRLMRDLAEGMRSFRANLHDEGEAREFVRSPTSLEDRSSENGG
jgi:sec-independent protein translocase protein TatA